MQRLMSKIMKIGTHNGTFHCDEALACFMLKQLPQYKNSEIVRTRDQSLLNECDIVVDVGGVFDPSKHRYDHHQKSFTETFKSLRPDKPWDIKLSSAGLVYVFFGQEILKEICKNHQSSIDIDLLYEKVYEHFVLEIDAIDNGVPVCEGEPRYSISSSISARVGRLNPWWNQKADENELFHKAMELVGSELLDKIKFYIKCWWPARELVQKAIDNRFNVHPSGSILKLELGGCPWKSHFFDLEKEIIGTATDNEKVGDSPKEKSRIMFVLYPDNATWRVQCIPISEKQGFNNRLSLLQDWRGTRDEELSQLSGIPDCVFVHASGFIGGNKTYEGALKMAVKTLDVEGAI